MFCTFAARSFRRRVAATPRLPRGYSVETSRGDAAATTWKFGRDSSVETGAQVPPGKHYKLTGLALRIRRTRWLGPCGACGSDVATDNIDLSEITDVDTYHHDVCAPCCCAAPDVVAVEFVDRPSGIETCSSGFATWIVHGESRRYRGCHVDRPWGIAAVPRVPRGSSARNRGGAVGATWIVCTGRPRRGGWQSARAPPRRAGHG